MTLSQYEETLYENEALRKIMFNVVEKMVKAVPMFFIDIEKDTIMGLPIYPMRQILSGDDMQQIKIIAGKSGFIASIDGNSAQISISDIVRLIDKAKRVSGGQDEKE